MTFRRFKLLPDRHETGCFTEGNSRISHTAQTALLLAWLLCAAALLGAQQEGEFSFEIQPDGTPKFTQVLRWRGDPNALFYEVAVQTAEGKAVSESRVTEAALRLNLSPGEYRYQIVLYNLLKRPEVTLPWQPLTVLKAEFPTVSESAPRMWFLEDLKPVLDLSGENLMPGLHVALRREGGSLQPISGAETTRETTAKVSVAFPAAALEAGTYTVEVTNPGGLSFILPHALLVRHMLSAPTGLAPASATVYGPKELRGMRSIRFSWNPVPEATHYIFRLYRAAGSKAVVRADKVGRPDYLLDDLTVLDSGDFFWTVEPQGSDVMRGNLPAVAAAQSRFRIELPELKPPSTQPGDLFYGK